MLNQKLSCCFAFYHLISIICCMFRSSRPLLKCDPVQRVLLQQHAIFFHKCPCRWPCHRGNMLWVVLGVLAIAGRWARWGQQKSLTKPCRWSFFVERFTSCFPHIQSRDARARTLWGWATIVAQTEGLFYRSPSALNGHTDTVKVRFHFWNRRFKWRFLTQESWGCSARKLAIQAVLLLCGPSVSCRSSFETL